eukprot:TRINITY_DN12603_c0_g2_i2.p1 TRINITY_DN12603_c0_g2~~TRINITY_DN12603_c0_g2_i2.p1  ORF type:complete len:3577 (-),score=536.17 TRINITY_DN12603_c0_g2_i2:97-9687(-)
MASYAEALSFCADLGDRAPCPIEAVSQRGLAERCFGDGISSRRALWTATSCEFRALLPGVDISAMGPQGSAAVNVRPVEGRFGGAAELERRKALGEEVLAFTDGGQRFMSASASYLRVPVVSNSGPSELNVGFRGLGAAAAGSFSIQFWLRRSWNETPKGGEAIIYQAAPPSASVSTGSEGVAGIYIGIVNNRLLFDFDGDGVWTRDRFDADAGVWVHWTFTYDALDGGLRRVYRDGRPVPVEPAGRALPDGRPARMLAPAALAADAAAASAVLVGRSPFYELMGALNGSLDELRFWSVALPGGTSPLATAPVRKLAPHSSTAAQPAMLATASTFQRARLLGPPAPPRASLRTGTDAVCRELVHVSGNRLADETFWSRECQRISPAANYVKVRMGGVTDYFRPVLGSSLCDMLTASPPRRHQWSADGVDWLTPDFSASHHGGSAPNWPRLQSVGGMRPYLSFWGSGVAHGGCCSQRLGQSKPHWRQPFTMEQCVGPPQDRIPYVITPRVANSSYIGVRGALRPGASLRLRGPHARGDQGIHFMLERLPGESGTFAIRVVGANLYWSVSTRKNASARLRLRRRARTARPHASEHFDFKPTRDGQAYLIRAAGIASLGERALYLTAETNSRVSDGSAVTFSALGFHAAGRAELETRHARGHFVLVPSSFELPASLVDLDSAKWECVGQSRINAEVFLGNGTVFTEDNCANFGFELVEDCKERCAKFDTCYAFNFDSNRSLCGKKGLCSMMDTSVDPTPVNATSTSEVCTKNMSAALGGFEEELRTMPNDPRPAEATFCQPFGPMGEYLATSTPKRSCTEICGLGFMGCSNAWNKTAVKKTNSHDDDDDDDTDEEDSGCLHGEEVGCLERIESGICRCLPRGEDTPRVYGTEHTWLQIRTLYDDGKHMKDWLKMAKNDMSWEVWFRILEAPGIKRQLMGTMSAQPLPDDDKGADRPSRRRFASVFISPDGTMSLESNVGSTGDNALKGVLKVDARFDDGNWHSVAAVFKTTTSRLYLVVDGVATSGMDYFVADDDVAMDGLLQIGGSDSADVPGAIDGEFSNVQLWDRALDSGMTGSCMLTEKASGLMARFLLSGTLSPGPFGEFNITSNTFNRKRMGRWPFGVPAKNCAAAPCFEFEAVGAGTSEANGQYTIAKNEQYQKASVFRRLAEDADTEEKQGFQIRREAMKWILFKDEQPFYLAPPSLSTPLPPTGRWQADPGTKGQFPGPMLRCSDDSACSWTAWGDWEPCSVTCNLGKRQRTRQIHVAAKVPERCVNFTERVDVDECFEVECPIHCEYGDWGLWNQCPVTCGGGTIRRERVKTQDAAYGGICKPPEEQKLSCNLQECPIDCRFGQWEEWSPCTKTCGVGSCESRRTTLILPQFGGKDCSGTYRREKKCNVFECPELCDWSAWGTWTSCSGTCGPGLRSRVRSSKPSAISLKPGMGRTECLGEVMQTATCTLKTRCPQHCVWAAWGAFGSCSRSCGGGTIQRMRGIFVAAAEGGLDCPGADRESRPCNEQCCPVNCIRGAWTPWESCTRSCGQGKMFRSRSFTQKQSCGGTSCSPGELSQSRPCNPDPCPIDCLWSDWTDEACSASCGWGTKFKKRKMLRLVAYGGKRCKGLSVMIDSCYLEHCPVHCEWEQWQHWQPCSKSCDGGFKRRARKMVEDGAYGGELCENHTEQFESCNTMKCPKDCVMEPWLEWNTCSKSCGGGGQRSRYRIRLTEALEGGADCKGKEHEVGSCGDTPCEQDCKWDSWGQWGNCSLGEKGGVVRHRKRKTILDARDGGRPCKGGRTEIENCLRHCTWGPWTAWSMCSASCAPAGIAYRHRPFSPAEHGGEPCKGLPKETRNCSDQPCPLDCRWDNWGTWSACDKSCGGGDKLRYRGVVTQPAFGGKHCPGSRYQVGDCNTHLCMTDCYWHSWDLWGVCTATCGGGIERRYRLNTPATGGGKTCAGQRWEDRPCQTQACPVDCRMEPWGDWSFCSKSCGNGWVSRMRGVVKETAGGQRCAWNTQERRHCTIMPCPIDGWIDTWQKWAPCPVTCGGGTHTRVRKIHRARFNGRDAEPVPTSESKDCNTQGCPVHCEWGPWNSWSPCRGKCYQETAELGTKMRSREMAVLPENFGRLCSSGRAVQVVLCEPNCDIDCKWDDWMPWEGCKPRCLPTLGNGMKKRMRIQRPAVAGNGKACEGPREEDTRCPAKVCPADCAIGDWQPWGDCSRRCRGERLRSRPMENAVCGGKACDIELGAEKELCNDEDIKLCIGVPPPRVTGSKDFRVAGEPSTTTTTTTTTTKWGPCALMLTWAAVGNVKMDRFNATDQAAIAGKCRRAVEKYAETPANDVNVSFRNGMSAQAAIEAEENGKDGSNSNATNYSNISTGRNDTIVAVVSCTARDEIKALRLLTGDRNWEKRVFQAVLAGFMDVDFPVLADMKVDKNKALPQPQLGEPSPAEVEKERESASCIGNRSEADTWRTVGKVAAELTIRMGKRWNFVGKKVFHAMSELGAPKDDVLLILRLHVFPVISKTAPGPKAAADAVLQAGLAASACINDVVVDAAEAAANYTVDQVPGPGFSLLAVEDGNGTNVTRPQLNAGDPACAVDGLVGDEDFGAHSGPFGPAEADEKVPPTATAMEAALEAVRERSGSTLDLASAVEAAAKRVSIRAARPPFAAASLTAQMLGDIDVPFLRAASAATRAAGAIAAANARRSNANASMAEVANVSSSQAAEAAWAANVTTQQAAMLAGEAAAHAIADMPPQNDSEAPIIRLEEHNTIERLAHTAEVEALVAGAVANHGGGFLVKAELAGRLAVQRVLATRSAPSVEAVLGAAVRAGFEALHKAKTESPAEYAAAAPVLQKARTAMPDAILARLGGYAAEEATYASCSGRSTVAREACLWAARLMDKGEVWVEQLLTSDGVSKHSSMSNSSGNRTSLSSIGFTLGDVASDPNTSVARERTALEHRARVVHAAVLACEAAGGDKLDAGFCAGQAVNVSGGDKLAVCLEAASQVTKQEIDEGNIDAPSVARLAAKVGKMLDCTESDRAMEVGQSVADVMTRDCDDVSNFTRVADVAHETAIGLGSSTAEAETASKLALTKAALACEKVAVVQEEQEVAGAGAGVRSASAQGPLVVIVLVLLVALICAAVLQRRRAAAPVKTDTSTGEASGGAVAAAVEGTTDANTAEGSGEPAGTAAVAVAGNGADGGEQATDAAA